MDDHTTEYWAHQIRIGVMTAALMTALGAARIGLTWPGESRWWTVPLFAVAVAKVASVFLPWTRLVRSRRVRARLLLWWFAAQPMLLLFSFADQAGPVFYLPGAVLLMIMAAAF